MIQAGQETKLIFRKDGRENVPFSVTVGNCCSFKNRGGEEVHVISGSREDLWVLGRRNSRQILVASLICPVRKGTTIFTGL